jgi:hypothetical protein
MSLRSIDPVENRRRMLAGELYYAFTPELVAERQRCKAAIVEYSRLALSGEASRRALVGLWKK